jgi:hypothetical protein
MKPGEAVTVTATELASIITVPPYDSCREILRQALTGVKNRRTAGQVPLKSIVGDWKPAIISNATACASDFMLRRPDLVPLAWLAQRIRESGAPAAWEDEFKRKTGVAVTVSRELSEWAHQILREQVALRLYGEAVAK